MEMNTNMLPKEMTKIHFVAVLIAFLGWANSIHAQVDSNRVFRIEKTGGRSSFIELSDTLICKFNSIKVEMDSVLFNSIIVNGLSDGNWCVYDKDNKIILSGKFIEQRLISGEVYFYDRNDLLIKITQIP